VQQADRKSRKYFVAQFFKHFRRRLQIHFFRFFDQRINDINLPPEIDLAFDAFVNAGSPVFADDDRFDRCPSGRKFVYHGHVQIAVNRHCQTARDRGCRHHQNIGIVTARAKLGALQNADGTLANLKGVLTRDKIDFRKFQRAEDAASLRLELDDVVLPGQPLTVRVHPSEGNPRIGVTLTPLAGGDAFEERLGRDAAPGWQSGEFALAPGIWRVTAHAEGATSVSDLVVVASA